MPRELKELMTEEEHKAWDSLCRYKFEMFGYHSSRWVMLNKLLEKPLPNPWKKVVKTAERPPDSSAKRGNNENSRDQRPHTGHTQRPQNRLPGKHQRDLAHNFQFPHR